MKRSFTLGLVWGGAIVPLAMAVGTQSNVESKRPVDFTSDVLSIFKAQCVTCHSSERPSGGLNLSSYKGLMEGGDTGPAVRAGSPGRSELLVRIAGVGGKPRMPMGFAPLPASEVQLIKDWIAQGAKQGAGPKKHWAYIAPVRQTVPTVRFKGWVRNPIDNFVLAKIESAGLKPSAEAPKEKLVRRVYLDLIGLPPTLEQQEAFLNDKRQNAYESLVDSLLASPHYGERQARIWLDLARYADTNGYEADVSRTAWKYRDWVIAAFNRNLPYDQFSIEQLAGDLLPNPQVEQLVATGFHRNTMLNLEGGVDPDEAWYETINDRVATTSTVWFAQTLACARCHDHKYDPISQKDYFRFYAIFNNSAYEARGDANFGARKFFEPVISVPSKEQTQVLGKAESELKALEANLSSLSTKGNPERENWEREAALPVAWSEVAVKVEEGPVLSGSAIMSKGPFLQSHKLVLTGVRGAKAIRLTALADPQLVKNGPGRANSGNFILSKVSLSFPISEARATFVQNGYDLRGLFDDNGDTGWAVYPEIGRNHELVLLLKSPAETDVVQLELRFDSQTWPQHEIGSYKLEATTAENPFNSLLSPRVRTALSAPTRSADQENLVREGFIANSPATAKLRAEMAAVKARAEAIKRMIPTAMVLREKPGTGPILGRLHVRGQFLQPGEEVRAGVPTVLPQPTAARVNRLALAKWLFDPKHPLTARVQVNRMWEQYFGTGLVASSENFGTQGDKPTHPELLDWLATEFAAQKWNLKAIHKLIVMSATYRQASDATSAALKRDPANKLMARGPRFRLEAEAIRDNALAAAGLLNLTIGGPSVYPHQPDGIWNSPFSGERWMQSPEPAVYRRGIYTFWKRTATYPAFVNFDAPSREACTVRRTRTNTPLQALNLLNDPAFMEAARALGKRMASSGVEAGFRLCTGRHPTNEERQRLETLVKNLREQFRAKPEDAEKLAGGVEPAVWTMAANVLLNLDETITKD